MPRLVGRGPAVPDDGLPEPTVIVHCYVCGLSNRRRKVLRFNLIRGEMIDGRKTTRGAGSIHLCDECWSKGPRREMVRRKGRPRR